MNNRHIITGFDTLRAEGNKLPLSLSYKHILPVYSTLQYLHNSPTSPCTCSNVMCRVSDLLLATP